MASPKRYRAIFGMAKESCLKEDDLRHILATHFNYDSFKKLTDSQAGEFIELLKRFNPSLANQKEKKENSP